MKKHLLLLLAATGLMLGAVTTTQAIVIENPIEINWNGTCTDCPLGGPPSTATAIFEVEILGNGPDGTSTNIGYGNLHGFSFFSSNFPYGVFAGASDILGARGLISLDENSTALSNITIEFYPHYGYSNAEVGNPLCDDEWCEVISAFFKSKTDGTWELNLYGGAPQDVGTNGIFNPVPEPTTLALFSLGLLGLGRRRRRVM